MTEVHWFARYMRELRGVNGLSQQEVAERVGVNRAQIANWESGRTTASFPKWERWAKALGWEVRLSKPRECKCTLFNDHSLVLCDWHAEAFDSYRKSGKNAMQALIGMAQDELNYRNS